MSDYPGFRIAVIHAITGIDDDDEEGVATFFRPEGPMPLIAANPERLGQITAMAQAIADLTGQSFKITRFSVREDIAEISRKLS